MNPSKMLQTVGMGKYWTDPTSAGNVPTPDWKKKVEGAVDAHHDEARAQRMRRMPSCVPYMGMKDWGPTSKEYCFSSGDIDRNSVIQFYNLT